MSSPVPIGRITPSTASWLGLQFTAIALTVGGYTFHSTVSNLFVPILLRPFGVQTASLNPPPPPAAAEELSSGRLTPQPTRAASYTALPNSNNHEKSRYEILASQFTRLAVSTASRSLVIEVFATVTYAASAWRARSVNHRIWLHWAAATAIVATCFALKLTYLNPLERRVKRSGGLEGQVEPYEDAPLDQEAELRTIPMAMEEWGSWNNARGMMMLFAAVFGGSALILA